jgi:hypothetical protein
MNQDTKEVLNAIIDSLGLQIKAMQKMNDAIVTLQGQIADLAESLDENSDEIEKLKSEVAMLPRCGASYPNYPPIPYTPYYPQPLGPTWVATPDLPKWTVDNNLAYEHAFPHG